MNAATIGRWCLLAARLMVGAMPAGCIPSGEDVGISRYPAQLEISGASSLRLTCDVTLIADLKSLDLEVGEPGDDVAIRLGLDVLPDAGSVYTLQDDGVGGVLDVRRFEVSSGSAIWGEPAELRLEFHGTRPYTGTLTALVDQSRGLGCSGRAGDAIRMKMSF